MSIKMPSLHGLLIILEDDLIKIVKGDPKNGCAKNCRPRAGFIQNSIQCEDSADVEAVSKL